MEYQKITQKFQKIYNEIIQRQFQIRMIKKDIYLQKKDKENWWSKINNNGVIMEYQKYILEIYTWNIYLLKGLHQ